MGGEELAFLGCLPGSRHESRCSFQTTSVQWALSTVCRWGDEVSWRQSHLLGTPPLTSCWNWGLYASLCDSPVHFLLPWYDFGKEI